MVSTSPISTTFVKLRPLPSDTAVIRADVSVFTNVLELAVEFIDDPNTDESTDKRSRVLAPELQALMAVVMPVVVV